MPDHPEPPDRPPAPAPREAVQRWRLVVARSALDEGSSQRDQLQAWESALLRSGLPVAGLDAEPPRPRHALAAPLGAAIPGEAELVDVWLAERVPAWRVREALGGTLPPGHTLVEAYDVWLGAPALPGQVVASVYRAVFAAGAFDATALADAGAGLLAATSLIRERQKGTGIVSYDLRPFLVALEVDRAPEETVVRMTLGHDPERGIGRPDEVIAALGERIGVALEPETLVRERLILAPPPMPEPARPARPRTGRRPVPRARTGR